MGFYKKVLVLKQIESGFSTSNKQVSGICRIEIENGVAEVYLTLINIMPKSGADYKLMIVDGKKEAFLFDCGKRPSSDKFLFHSLPYLEEGVSAGVYAVLEDIPLTVAYSSDELSKCSLSEFKRLVAERCLNERRAQEKNSEKPSIKQPVDEPTKKQPSEKTLDEKSEQFTVTLDDEFQSAQPKTATQIYDDEAVATSNYYEFDEQTNEKLSAVKEWKNNEDLQPTDEQTDNSVKEKASACRAEGDLFQNETDASKGEEFSKEQPYYLSVKDDLERIFNNFPEETGLKNIFPQSRWSKIHYGKEKFYVVGLIKEEGKEKYICYGVPAVYSPNPPKELKGYCSFIPLSIFDLSGEGFWMMFQCAVTGDCIKPKPPFDK